MPFATRAVIKEAARGALHTELTRNPRSGLTPAQEHGAAGTFSPRGQDYQMNHNSGRDAVGARPWRTAAVVVATVVTGLLAVACGGGGSHPSGRANSDQNLSVVLDSYASCMRGHGVPNFYFTHLAAPPSAPPPGTLVLGYRGWFVEVDSDAQFQSAQKACQHLLPFGNAHGTETHQEFLSAVKSAECMRSHGYPNWPDPNPNTNGVWWPTGVDTKSTQFQAAAKTCGVSVPPGS
jgi:hypothetical protein